MGLKISTYKTKGNTFTDAYAKVLNVRYDNNAKIATFDIAIYPTKGDDNLIETIGNNWIKVESGSDMVQQCYDKLKEVITSYGLMISKIETELQGELTHFEKTRKEFDLKKLKDLKVLQLSGEVW